MKVKTQFVEKWDGESWILDGVAVRVSSKPRHGKPRGPWRHFRTMPVSDVKGVFGYPVRREKFERAEKFSAEPFTAEFMKYQPPAKREPKLPVVIREVALRSVTVSVRELTPVKRLEMRRVDDDWEKRGVWFPAGYTGLHFVDPRLGRGPVRPPLALSA